MLTNTESKLLTVCLCLLAAKKRETEKKIALNNKNVNQSIIRSMANFQYSFLKPAISQ